MMSKIVITTVDIDGSLMEVKNEKKEGKIAEGAGSLLEAVQEFPQKLGQVASKTNHI